MRRHMPRLVRASSRVDRVAVDDRNFRWRLKRPYSKMKYALGKPGTPCCFIMPERIATTAGNSMITEYVGSGPMTFKRDEWVPGAKAVFEKFGRYTPREGTASWLAGPKRILVDRLEWVVMPDPAGWVKGGAPAWSNGFLPATYQGTILRGGAQPILNLNTPKDVSAQQQLATVNLINQLNRENLPADEFFQGG